MCGIVGIASGVLSAAEEKVFEGMLQVDVIRGKDSTGVAVVKKTGYSVVKKVGVPQELLDSRRYEAALRGANSVLIGHNRWATVGKTNSANAHPFDVGGIVGVHNGTLENKHAIDPDNHYDTDSEALYAHIKQHGVKNTIQLVRGAWALVWWDDNDCTLNFLRNKERPLYIGMSENNTTMVWASEAWMIFAICGREGLKVKSVAELPTDKHVSYDIPTLGTDPITENSRMDVKGALPFIPKITPPTTSSTGSTESRMKALINKEFQAKAGLLVFEGASIYIRYLAKGHYMEEFRVYFPSKEIAEQHANKEATILAKYMVSANGWPKYLSCEIVYPDVDEEAVIEEEVCKPLSKETFNKLYKECAWCSDQLDYDEDWFVSASGMCVCEQCAKEPDVKTYLNIQ